MSEFSGFADITYSPDDEASAGKGWYAQTINKDGSYAEESDLFETQAQAMKWARDHGATRFLSTE